jgi:hypothetical protein
MRASVADTRAIAISTAPAVATAALKRAIALAEARLVFIGGLFALLDVTASMSACFLPGAAGFLNLARVATLGVLLVAVLHALVIRDADRCDTELLKAVAVVVAVVVVSVVTRTSLAVPACSL